ncbi:hypothetical protein EYW49_05035 [Siculibacillus lacustris]|uniref:BrnA antitoxin family protein n=1 Tax=Siculibacillus lacustris TaxID=1549641 RepID=A0A4Q9VV11_9HYPH|nr:BrnA antitoxin family protein [Siculibacillus lacustris]TBW40036.1 hypothetical protein EYW49_05035 [Siculibacillus lacustris]
MSRPPIRRSGTTPRDAAEAAFRSATAKPVEAPLEAPRPPSLPNVREAVTLRLDRAVLDHFQADGPGWQDRINDALRGLVAAATPAERG